mmetsp:Transcript_86166/g.230789  ORF Transcript_86166/g.230789 Transcript_86166/m.230789 type:complete len:562 (+) Transcript_86166:33-1718(+)
MRAVTRRIPKECAIIACLFGAAPTGLLYGFSLYSEALRSKFDLTDGELLNISTLPSAMGFCGPFVGAAAQSLSPVAALMIGAAIMASCQGMMYAVAAGAVQLGNVAIALPVLSCVSYIGMATITSVVFSIPVHHFQHRRGEAIALVKAFVGLAGAAVAQIYWLWIGYRSDLKPSDPESLTGILLWVCVIVVTVFVCAVLMPAKAVNDPAKESRPRLNVLFWMLLAWGVCATVVGVVHLPVVHRILAVSLLVLLVAPLVLLAIWGCSGERTSAAPAEACFEREESAGFWQMIRSLDAWCLFLSYLGTIGGGLFLSSSLAQILKAGGNSTTEANVLAQTLYSTGNMLGRLTGMGPSDAIVRRGLPRPLFVGALLLGMAFSNFMFLLLPAAGGSEVIIAVAAFAGGMSFGSTWPHMVIITSEIFGSRNLQTNYMFYDGCVACVGSLVFARFLASAVYQANVGPDNECVGGSCFRITHLVVLLTNVVGLLGVTAVCCRNAKLYVSIGESIRDAATGSKTLLEVREQSLPTFAAGQSLSSGADDSIVHKEPVASNEASGACMRSAS